jgi:hypothetical protein
LTFFQCCQRNEISRGASEELGPKYNVSVP